MIFYQELKHGKSNQKRSTIKVTPVAHFNRKHIHERPAVIEQRKRIGDLETDLILRKINKTAVIVLKKRITLITMVDKS
jgi:IS30 family transposase